MLAKVLIPPSTDDGHYNVSMWFNMDSEWEYFLHLTVFYLYLLISRSSFQPGGSGLGQALKETLYVSTTPAQVT